jgi:hypothetical protein
MGVKHLVPINQLKTTLLAKFAHEGNSPIVIDYDDDFDALSLRIVPMNIETVVHYVDDHVALLYKSDNYEIVGLHIEDFEHSFLPAHESVRREWKLSESGIELKDVGELIFIVERKKRDVAREVVNATKDILGEPAPELIAAFA